MHSIIKLTSGETLIAEVVNEDEYHVSVIDPLLLEIGEGDTGNPVMMAMSWIPLLKPVNLVNLKSPHVIAVAECEEEVVLYYKKSLAVLKKDDALLREVAEAERALRQEEIELGWEDEDEDSNVIPFEHVKQSANTVH
jgi:hypothetical protein